MTSQSSDVSRCATRVTAVIVTRDRRALLEQCLEAVERQSHAIERIVVVDNASDDDTPAFLATRTGPIYKIARLDENIGGAGGFAHGIRLAAAEPADLFWLMDDDCIPSTDALEQLVLAGAECRALGVEYSFLCSRVVDLDGNACNHPVPSTARNKSGWPRWAELSDHGYILVDECTFVSVALSTGHVLRAGLPFCPMFIWGDDTEYTRRLSLQAPGIFIGRSHVLHKRRLLGELSVHTEDSPARLAFYRHHYRNRMFLFRHYFPRGRYFAFLVQVLWDILRLLGRGQAGRAMLVGRGFVEGLFFRPRIEPVIADNVRAHDPATPDAIKKASRTSEQAISR